MTDTNRVGKRLALFERVRKNRASRVQILSSVRANLEKTVEDKVRRYADSPDDRKWPVLIRLLSRKRCSLLTQVKPEAVPSSMMERTIHDHRYAKPTLQEPSVYLRIVADTDLPAIMRWPPSRTPCRRKKAELPHGVWH